MDVDYGLVAGISFSLLTLAIRTQRPHACIMGRLPATDVYRDTRSYRMTREIPGIRIFRFDGPLNFASAEHFRERIVALVTSPRSSGLDEASQWTVTHASQPNFPVVPEEDGGAEEMLRSQNQSSLPQSQQHQDSPAPPRRVSNSAEQGTPLLPFPSIGRVSWPALAEDRLKIMTIGCEPNSTPDSPDRLLQDVALARTSSNAGVALTAVSTEEDVVEDMQVVTNLARFKERQLRETSDPTLRHVIIDCASLNYVDLVGVKALATVIKNFKTGGVTVLLAACNYNVRRMLEKNQLCRTDSHQIFLSVHDAVIACLIVQSGFGAA